MVALVVRAGEKARTGCFKTRTLRAIRESVGHCENCGTAEALTIHHTTQHWLFGIVVYCNECHTFWHWLVDNKKKGYHAGERLMGLNSHKNSPKGFTPLEYCASAVGDSY